MKKPLKIKYVGGGEQGLDMGGLQKEFFHMIVDCIFDEGTWFYSYDAIVRPSWGVGLLVFQPLKKRVNFVKMVAYEKVGLFRTCQKPNSEIQRTIFAFHK